MSEDGQQVAPLAPLLTSGGAHQGRGKKGGVGESARGMESHQTVGDMRAFFLSRQFQHPVVFRFTAGLAGTAKCHLEDWQPTRSPDKVGTQTCR